MALGLLDKQGEEICQHNSLWSLVSSIFVTVWEYNLFVSDYGKFAQFADSTVFSWLPVIDETVVLACQIFNLERSYRINGNRILVLVIITPFMLATTGLILARRIATSILKNPEFNVTQMIQPPPHAYLFTNVATDVMLTSSIAYGLWKSKTGWKNTDHLLKRVIVYTVKSQLPPAIAATVIAIQFAANNKTTMVFLYMICNSKIPAVMFMAVLNFRFELRRDQPHTHVLSSSAALVGSDHNEPGGIATHYNDMNDIPMLDRQQPKDHDSTSFSSRQWRGGDRKLNVF